MSVSSAIAVLRAAIRATLLADADFVTALGGAAIYDVAPRDAQTPYLTFGDAQARDWSTGSDFGLEQFVILNVWSTQPGAAQALDLVVRAADLLDGASPTLAGFHLVNLRLTNIDTKRETNGRYVRASLRLRAVVEPL